MIYALFSVIILFAITLFIAAGLKIDLETAQAQAAELRRMVEEQQRTISAISKIPGDNEKQEQIIRAMSPCPHCGELHGPVCPWVAAAEDHNDQRQAAEALKEQ